MRRGRSVTRRSPRAIQVAPRGRSIQPSSTDSTNDDVSGTATGTYSTSDEKFEGEDKLLWTA